MDGNLTTTFTKEENNSWMMEMSMIGKYSTPWPEKTIVSGDEWVNPEGNLIEEVPYIDTGIEVLGKLGMK